MFLLGVWQSVPGAVDWARRIRNTLLFVCATDFQRLKYPDGSKVDLNTDRIARLISNEGGGVCLNAKIPGKFGSLLIKAAHVDDSGKLVTALLESGAPPYSPEFSMQLIQYCAYVDRPLPVIEILLKYGEGKPLDAEVHFIKTHFCFKVRRYNF
jgi:hypothetical protein